jgi:hypothetical protein
MKHTGRIFPAAARRRLYQSAVMFHTIQQKKSGGKTPFTEDSAAGSCERPYIMEIV